VSEDGIFVTGVLIRTHGEVVNSYSLNGDKPNCHCSPVATGRRAKVSAARAPEEPGPPPPGKCP